MGRRGMKEGSLIDLSIRHNFSDSLMSWTQVVNSGGWEAKHRNRWEKRKGGKRQSDLHFIYEWI